MTELRRCWAILGSIVFFCVVPGSVAGAVPFMMTGWRQQSRVPEPIHLLGIVCVLVGLTSLIESMVQFVMRGRGTPAPVAPPSKLVVTGQYRYLRNPMYVAVVLIVLGQAAWLGSMALLVYGAILFVFFHVWVVCYEEPTLARQFGASFEQYRQGVHRWWPRIQAWRAE
jgi:protein-S-isoprenylcysteine O-methyltransferase Ste14